MFWLQRIDRSSGGLLWGKEQTAVVFPLTNTQLQEKVTAEESKALKIIPF